MKLCRSFDYNKINISTIFSKLSLSSYWYIPYNTPFLSPWYSASSAWVVHNWATLQFNSSYKRHYICFYQIIFKIPASRLRMSIRIAFLEIYVKYFGITLWGFYDNERALRCGKPAELDPWIHSYLHAGKSKHRNRLILKLCLMLRLILHYFNYLHYSRIC